MLTKIKKRDGKLVPFMRDKITWAIFKAASNVGGDDWELASKLCDKVIELAEEEYPDSIAEVEGVQDIVEKVLIKNGHAKTAKAFILYREKRKTIRENNALVDATADMFTQYLDDESWEIKENSNMQKSINGMNNYIREAFTKQYWLNEIYSADIREAHNSGDIHIHDLGFFGA